MTKNATSPDGSPKPSGMATVPGPKRPVYFSGTAFFAGIALVMAAPAWGGDGRSDGLPSITTNGEWRQIAPESSWSVWRPECIVQSVLADSMQENPATTTLSISTVGGTGIYLMAVSSSLWTDIADKEKLSVNFGFDDEEPEEGVRSADQIVLGHTSVGEAGPGFLAGVEADFLRRMARSATLEVYRDGSKPISMDMSGAAKALEILLACGKEARAGLEKPVEELYTGERSSPLPGAGNAGQ